MIIGLTGGIGSGKSTVAQIFRSLGANVLDSDQITRQLITPSESAFEAILAHFGNPVLQTDGTINRAWLRTRIFEQQEDKIWLEALLHPLVKEKIKIARTSSPYLIVEIPLLLEAHFQDSVDRILVVDCSEQLQIARVGQRDGLSPTDIQKIISSQVSRSTRLTAANDVIQNESDSKTELRTKVQALHDYYRSLIKPKSL